MSEKNCGTCGWWDKWQGKNEGVFGHCLLPLPACFYEGDRYTMAETEGTSCPCWKEAE